MSAKAEKCHYCGNVRRTYKRKFPIGDLLALYSLYRSRLAGNEWVHIKDLQGKSGGGDFAKYRYWNLIEERSNDSPEKKNAGYWRLTNKGIEFASGRMPIRTHALVVEGNCFKLEGELVYIKDLWELGGFDFKELMSLKGQGDLFPLMGGE
jgi:hypothetical protein